MFDSFGFKGPKNFIIQDDKKIINEILYEKLINKELVTLSSSAKAYFILLKSLVNYIIISRKNTETDTCGLFHLFYYENFFMPDHESTIVSDTKYHR